MRTLSLFTGFDSFFSADCHLCDQYYVHTVGYCFVLQFKSTSMEGKVKFNFQCGAIKLYMPCVTR